MFKFILRIFCLLVAVSMFNGLMARNSLTIKDDKVSFDNFTLDSHFNYLAFEDMDSNDFIKISSRGGLEINGKIIIVSDNSKKDLKFFYEESDLFYDSVISVKNEALKFSLDGVSLGAKGIKKEIKLISDKIKKYKVKNNENNIITINLSEDNLEEIIKEFVQKIDSGANSFSEKIEKSASKLEAKGNKLNAKKDNLKTLISKLKESIPELKVIKWFKF